MGCIIFVKFWPNSAKFNLFSISQFNDKFKRQIVVSIKKIMKKRRWHSWDLNPGSHEMNDGAT